MADFKKHIIRDIKKIQEEMDILFDHFYKVRHSPVLTSRRLWRPPADVIETTSEIIILVEIGGMKQRDLSISLADNVLVIRGERKEKNIKNMSGYRSMEINYGMFERNIYLPETVDTKEIIANYKNGFLEIRINKKNDKIKGKQIKVE
ncbi:MAG: Hsp20/alpha crystallin family protein [candidate division Zixibacteria bacterium]|nr:Hsp20/alpha crystallin family protein [candidate division Zixibacteria bacterium]